MGEGGAALAATDEVIYKREAHSLLYQEKIMAQKEFEIEDLYDIKLERFYLIKAYHEEMGDWEDGDSEQSRAYFKELMGELKRGEESMLVKYNGNSEHVVIPEGVTGIKKFVFSGNKVIKSVVLPESLTRVFNAAFCDCTALEDIKFGNNLFGAGEYAFKGTALRSVTLPSSVQVMERGAFFGCTALEKIDLGENIKYIAAETFTNCSALKRVIIPKSVQYIDTYAFFGCTALEEIYIPSTVTIEENGDPFCKCKKSLRVYIQKRKDGDHEKLAKQLKRFSVELVD